MTTETILGGIAIAVMVWTGFGLGLWFGHRGYKKQHEELCKHIERNGPL
jgi:hypothetical protein